MVDQHPVAGADRLGQRAQAGVADAVGGEVADRAFEQRVATGRDLRHAASAAAFNASASRSTYSRTLRPSAIVTTPLNQPDCSSTSVRRVRPSASVETVWRPTMRTPGWRLAQVNVVSSTSSLTSHSPAARPFCLTWARLPTRRSPSSRRRTSWYVVIRSGQRLDIAQHLPDPRRVRGDGEALLVLHDVSPSCVPNGTSGSIPPPDLVVERVTSIPKARLFPRGFRGFSESRASRSRGTAIPVVTVKYQKLQPAQPVPGYAESCLPGSAVHRTTYPIRVVDGAGVGDPPSGSTDPSG